MSEPFWTPLGGQPVDYEGTYDPAVQYVPGDVVRYQGVDYLAVNPSLGTTPPLAASVAVPLVTALPASPADGQEVVFTDSLTAPTFTWRLRYVAAKASNRWVFVGGSPIITEVAVQESTASGTYVALTTPGPSITLPLAGDYIVELGHRSASSAGGVGGMQSYDIGATPANDADAFVLTDATAARGMGSYKKRKSGLGAVTLTSKYRVFDAGGTRYFQQRWMSVEPIAVGG
jgi:hypothetical protein